MPILKVKTRRDTNFKQLIEYVYRDSIDDERSFTHLHNIYLNDPDSTSGMVRAFVKNDKFRKKRSNGIGQYHEMISFHPEESAFLKDHPEVLEDFARIYLEVRAPNSLGVAVPHFDTDHVHLHFVISANEVESSKASRISKKDLAHYKELLGQLQVKYPELQQSFVPGKFRFDLSSNQSKPLPRSQAKTYLRETISRIIETANDNFSNTSLEKENLQLYYRRGKPQGVLFEKRKYRFTSLFEKESIEMEQLQGLDNEPMLDQGNELELIKENS